MKQNKTNHTTFCAIKSCKLLTKQKLTDSGWSIEDQRQSAHPLPKEEGLSATLEPLAAQRLLLTLKLAKSERET